MSEKVAIVTGGNKGIGFEIVKGLCAKFNGIVYLTARDEKRRRQAVEKLNKIGLKPEFFSLDVSERSSVAAFADHIKKKHGGFDLIVNNAGIMILDGITPYYEEANAVININYKSILTIHELLFPLLRDNARVVNISSDIGHLSNLRKQEWIDFLSKKDLTIADVNIFVEAYLESLKNGNFDSNDYADDGRYVSYRISKIALTAATFIYQKELNAKNISMNAVHPGFVKTDMTTGLGYLSPEEGASTPLYLALDAPSSLKGCYVWFDKTLVDWYDAKGEYYLKSKNNKSDSTFTKQK